MSSRMERRMQPAYFKDVEVGTNCDRCGVDIPDTDGNYAVRRFELEFMEGMSFPEGSDLEGWELADCCDACVAILHDLLVANGFRVQPKKVCTY